MKQSINMQRFNLERSLPIIINQEIPILETSPVYMFFLGRKTAATKYLSEKLSVVGKEELLNYIEYCNETIKKYLAL